jgi:HSP20 family protein
MYAYHYDVRPARRPQNWNRWIDTMTQPSRAVGGEVYTLPVDVLASDEAYTVLAAVPGLRSEDLKLEVLGDTVTIRGKVETPEAADQERWLLRERRGGEFARTLVLPTEVNGAAAEATIDNGLLRLHLPKAEAARPKTIKVKAK